MTGSEVQIDKLKSLLDKDQVFARKLLVNVAYHSSRMDEIATEYSPSIQYLDGGDVHPNSSIMFSSVISKIVTLDEIQQSGYWIKNLTSPVMFSSALAQMCSGKNLGKILGDDRTFVEVNTLLEIGPHSAMQGPTKDILREVDKDGISYDSVMVRSASALDTLLGAVGRLTCLAIQSMYPRLTGQV